jgi:ParB/RepB/Spo0J family partition protein
MPPSPPKPFAGRARVASLTERSVFTPRTDAVLSSAAPVPTESIEPNPNNPRQVVKRDEAFIELLDSIREYGLLQPLLVRREGIRRVLIAGHRRLAAVQQLAAEAPEDPRWRKVLTVERVADERQAVVLGLVENLHREDLEPQDEASALEALEHELGSLQAVANAIKRSKAYVSRRIRVYQDPVLATAILERGLAPTTAQEFLPVKSRQQRQSLVQDALRESWDAPQARAAVKDRCESQRPAASSAHGETCCDSQQRGIDERRSQALVRAIGTMRRLLHAGPASALSVEASAELHNLAQELSQQFPY